MRTPICDRLGIEFPIFAFSHCRAWSPWSPRPWVRRARRRCLHARPARGRARLDRLPRRRRPLLRRRHHRAGEVRRHRAGWAHRGAVYVIATEHREFLDQLLERYGVEALPEQGGRGGGDELMGFSHESGRALLDVVWAHEKVRLVANALGPAPDYLVTDERGILVAGLVGTVVHAERQRAAGVDLVIAQGAEAGDTGDRSARWCWCPRSSTPWHRRRCRCWRHRRRTADRRRWCSGWGRCVVRIGVATTEEAETHPVVRVQPRRRTRCGHGRRPASRRDSCAAPTDEWTIPAPPPGGSGRTPRTTRRR